RVGGRVKTIEIGFGDVLPLAGIVAVILALAFYPQFGLRRSQASVRATLVGTEAQQHQFVGWTGYAPLSASVGRPHRVYTYSSGSTSP
ncbi:MAG: hypothetical protein ACRDL8_12395, partial [Solirubrobacteraceae bacterium]